MLSEEREKEIRIRLNASPGQAEFDPAYMYKNPNSDVRDLLAEIERLRDQLNSRNNTQVTGYCIRCEEMSGKWDTLKKELALARERLGPAGYKILEEQRRDYVELAKAYGEALKKLDALKPFPKGKLTNSGHGHVYSRLDGSIARCGGPGLCGKCSADLARKLQDEDDASNNTPKE